MTKSSKATSPKPRYEIFIAPRTLADVRETLAEADKFGTADRMARLLRKHGNITEEARAWLVAQHDKEDA